MARLSVVVVALALAAAPGNVFADPEARSADLIDALGSLTHVALSKADEAAELASSAEYRRDVVADRAAALALGVHRKVVRNLKLGSTYAWTRARFADLNQALWQLDDAVGKPGIGFSVISAYNTVLAAWTELDDALAPVALTATCTGEFGGNFFNKKTHVSCTVTGHGASSYFVAFTNEVNGQSVSANAQGALSPSATQQTFETGKVSVGRFATYEVYLYDSLGNAQLVATGEAQGNPF